MQIASKLADKAKINITDGTINKLGKALKKHNFLRLKKNGIFVYALIENTWEEVNNSNKMVEEEKREIPIQERPKQTPKQENLPFE
ncbi:hypothetical protein [Flavobacterium rhamnosiphilum]|uniref:hypothetical protein n=1 Tax=Flavobacterium rhamnosiphilum TaxID=2541724 RepID=UPI00197AC9B1|nr:hypothetical protein [Flavobacterium rhamnosiphilum]